jgi:hypothetical protein
MGRRVSVPPHEREALFSAELGEGGEEGDRPEGGRELGGDRLHVGERLEHRQLPRWRLRIRRHRRATFSSTMLAATA